MSRSSLLVLMLAVAMVTSATEAAGFDAVEGQRAGEVGELAADGGDHGVLGGEADPGVAGVDDPGAGGLARGRWRVEVLDMGSFQDGVGELT